MSRMKLGSIAFLGSGKKTARVDFRDGLNVICGSSDTGKTYILDTVNFMLGGKDLLRDIPERAGYDRVRMSIDFTDDSQVILERSIDGGGFRVFDCGDIGEELGDSPVHLNSRHHASKENNLSAFLLDRIKLRGNFLRKNARGVTTSLSFRNLVPFSVVSEGAILETRSPFLTGNPTTATTEYSLLKLLLTGLDDSAVVAETIAEKLGASNSGKLEVLDQLIEDQREELDAMASSREELQEQLDRIEATLSSRGEALENMRNALSPLLSSRSELMREIGKRRGRIDEISELLDRFTLLEEHYLSDLDRLEAIQETGSLFISLDKIDCPLCGASPYSQHVASTCDGNVESVITAATSEVEKVRGLLGELNRSVRRMDDEKLSLEEQVVVLNGKYQTLEDEISGVASPTARSQKEFRMLAEKRAEVSEALAGHERLEKLEAMRLEVSGELLEDAEEKSSTDISTSILDHFSQRLQAILLNWGYPNANRVSYDKKLKDFQISGKGRGSTGKGLRAITHAAVKVALMEHCHDNDLPHPGFLFLDSPLLAYSEPEGVEDDLSGTDIKERFYRYLNDLKGMQVVVIENTDTPPEDLLEQARLIHFTKNPTKGRFGLFPI